jgi:hypothetical protein
MDDLGVIGEMSGVAVHDGWKPYRHYDIDHALCNAHSAEPGIMRNSRATGDRMAWRTWVRWMEGRDRFCIITPP